MFLITELSDDKHISYQLYEENNRKNLFIEGIFMQGNIKNRNGRFYPITTLETAVQKYKQTHITENRALGELGHPQGPQINAERACLLITELNKNGNDYIGKAKILEALPMGNIAKGLIESGVKVGVSSRGMGSLKSIKEGIMEVQNDFNLAAIDIVMDPSAPNAFVKGILEGVSWIYDASTDSWHQERLANTAKKLKQTPVISEQVKIRVFKNFFDSLVNQQK